ncbi:MAG: DUF1538 family protein, partial [Clostridia bacterium]|nr:DUF1538 family protein [Clostridia bacterium]
VGLASARSDKNSSDDSFGLVAMSSIGPILTVLVLGLLYNPDKVEETITESFKLESTTEIAKTFAYNLPKYAEEVLVSLAPILAVFLIFQVFWRRFSRRDVNRIAVGLVYTYVGLVLFLCGVNVGFAPLGNLFGGQMAEQYKWALLPIGALIGYFIVKAEPAIQVLNHQVDTVTNGAISAHAMNRCMSVGVSVSVALAMLRILLHIPILYILIPGYVIALVLTRFVPKIFVGIAFDSGGVASGPMTSTFLLPLSAGACKALGGNIMTEAFGVVSLVALTPLIAIQVMGVVYQLKTRRLEKTAVVEAIPADSDDIVIFEEA